jgi:hypothetical protein
MKLWILLTCGLLAAAVASGAPADSRFSQGLTEAERGAAGINALSSDQVAALNALVRRAAEAALDASAAPAPTFSQGLLPDEFHAAGLEQLSHAQLTQLDRLVGAQLKAPAAPSVAVLSPGPAGAGSPVPTETERIPPEIHGMVSLGYGWGGGGSERSMETALSYVDPTHHFAVTLDYADLSGKSPCAYPSRVP